MGVAEAGVFINSIIFGVVKIEFFFLLLCQGEAHDGMKEEERRNEQRV